MKPSAGARWLRVVAAIGALLLLGACGGGGPTEPAGGGGGGGKKGPSFETLKQGEIKIGSCLDYPPFEYYKGKQLKGFDVELSEAIAGKLGLKPVWVKANFDTIFAAVKANKFDMVAAASTITPERKKQVNFSEPYYNARQALTINKQKTPDIKTTDDLSSGDIVGVQKGTTGKDWAEQHLGSKGVQIKTFDAAPDAFTDLEAGNIVGIINDEPSSEEEVSNRPSLEVVEPIDTGEHYGLAFSPSNPELTVAVNKALEELIGDGTYAQIFKKYFPGTPVPEEYQ
jgi:polar amino acid transport system substrate-binding protein